MKKLVLAIAAAAILALTFSTSVEAGGPRGGIIGGFTSSASNPKSVDASSIGGFHIGLTAQLPIAFGFAVQPSVLYQTKGSKLSEAGYVNYDMNTKVSYVEIPVQVQWGPDLVAFRPYVFAEPFVGYGLNAKVKNVQDGTKTKMKSFEDSGLARWEYGLGLGVGIDVWKLQISAKYFWNFGSLYSDNGKKNTISENIKEAFKDGRNFNGITFSLALMF